MLLLYTSWQYIDFLKSKRDALAASKHKIQALSMHEKVSSMILQKQKSTVAMALSIASDRYLAENIKNRHIKRDYYKELIEKFRENTLYKNIWIQLLDKDINSLYRSWSPKRGDSLKNIRQDLVNVALTKKVAYSVSVGKFNLTIKAIVPLFIGEEFIGIIEVISHFNSISKQLKKSNIDSVVVLKKEFKKQLEYPFTKLFIDDYYVANFDAPHEARDYLKENGIEKYFNNSYKIENGQIIASYELKNKDENPVGYYIMFKKIDTISNMDLDFFMFKWLTLGIIVIMSIAIIVSTMLFFANRRQKKYFHNIINSATNIVLINNRKTLLDVNMIFFKYFDRYKTLEEFKKDNECICDFFVEEEGCIKADMDGVKWVDYLVENHSKVHKIKIDIFGKVYYFSVSASKVLKEKNYYSIVLTDITEQENYKKELEHLSVTDALTGIGNRRYFHQKIEEEIHRAKRYQHPLSLIMFDIDFFKHVNDKHGHSVGDEVLIEYTKLINSLLREGDVFCRIGGEEFIIILPHALRDEAQKIAEKLRAKIEFCQKVIPITMSFGVVEYIVGEEIEFIFKRVDDALYKAKESGRNIVVVG
ncbi:diguanylate cyclase (GGDEF domain) [Sulfurimonas gotlandica GD1]|uniref:diguanylate cyclase n=1 Tax=Sulfurimonas gotlandica (strain DSM 19862 / JCM 16533 / GD1) TaxID=929558 RepID=B6BHU8_SULGG|nr:diguanylate cyclase [Sulfurimonas gotlandica GD1]EHP30099.1 diguanylate cyclase (GGDEF domain) [Sulfurimonas gotlandica GD1]